MSAADELDSCWMAWHLTKLTGQHLIFILAEPFNMKSPTTAAWGVACGKN